MTFSERTKNLSINLFDILCIKYGFDTNIIDKENILINYSLVDIFDKIKSYSLHKYSGKYGPLNPDLQKSLNFKLAILDLKKASIFEKKKLISDVISLNDSIIDKRNRYNLNNEFIKGLLINYDINNNDFLIFLKKFDLLFTQKKSELWQVINDDTLYTSNLRELELLFERYLQRAIDLSLSNST